MEDKIEKEELGQEIIGEWYAEKGFFNEEQQKVVQGQEKEEAPAVGFVPSTTQKVDEEKKHEEEKKLLVKKEIKMLLALAEKKGLEKSISEARKKNDPFLLDIYHDVIARDHAYHNLLKKNK